jgi:uncharacterized protein YjdB
MRSYPFRLDAKGKRITVTIESNDTKYAEIGGVQWDVSLGRARRGSAVAEAGDAQSGVPSALHILPSSFALPAGAVKQLLVIGLDVNNVEVPVGEVQWQSSDDTKATVSSTGVVTRVAAGAVTITASVGALSVQSFGTML